VLTSKQYDSSEDRGFFFELDRTLRARARRAQSLYSNSLDRLIDCANKQHTLHTAVRPYHYSRSQMLEAQVLLNRSIRRPLDVTRAGTHACTFIRGVLAHPRKYTFDHGWERAELRASLTMHVSQKARSICARRHHACTKF
jgi:hypothetical protein